MKERDQIRVVFVCSEKNREFDLADSFLGGVVHHGDLIKKVRKSLFNESMIEDGDVFCMVGVKSWNLYRQIRDAGKHVLFFDKGYFRHRIAGARVWEYWRVSLDTHHPTDYVAAAKHGPERWDAIAKARLVEVKPWRKTGAHIVYAGSSEKYHAFCRLPNPTVYATEVIKQLKKLTNRLIVYRPKPTWEEAEPIRGSSFSSSNEKISDVLENCWCLVTNGSNAAYDAVISGIPCIVLGESIAKPISSQTLDDIEAPYLATDEERNQWLANLAWCMFTEDEMRSELAWKALRPQIFGKQLDDSTMDEVVGVVSKPSKAQLKKMGISKKPWKKTRTKEEQRAHKAFTKTRPDEPPDEWEDPE